MLYLRRLGLAQLLILTILLTTGCGTRHATVQPAPATASPPLSRAEHPQPSRVTPATSLALPAQAEAPTLRWYHDRKSWGPTAVAGYRSTTHEETVRRTQEHTYYSGGHVHYRFHDYTQRYRRTQLVR